MTKSPQWEKLDVNTIDLQLDPINYRLPQHLKYLSQQELLNALIDFYDVLSLAEGISDRGFYPNESLVVVKEHGRLVVVEGNRRLAACKALLMPTQLSNGKRKKFTQLSSVTNLDQIKKLSVVIAPSRDVAIGLIESLHTTPGRLKWDTLAKARFDKENRSDDKSKLFEANKVLDTYKAATSIKLDKEIEAQVKSESHFNVTNLIRIFNDEHCKNYLGYDYNTKGNLIVKIKPQEFQAGLQLLLNDIVTQKSFSRLTDKAEDRRKYIEEKKKQYATDTRKTGDLTVDEFIDELGNDAKPSNPRAGEPIKSRDRTPKTKNVIPRDFKCLVKHTRIKKVFNEISDLPLDKFPNSTSIMLRLLLEISLFEYLESTGEIKKMKTKLIEDLKKKKQQLPPHWTPELKEMLRWISDPKSSLVNGHISRKIRSMIEAKSQDPVLYNLNQFVHNPEEIPDSSSIKKTWHSLEGLFKVLLTSTAS